MLIPANILANADDLGTSSQVNTAILYCFENGYINSTSFLTNTPYFDETVSLIHGNEVIQNVGLHINLTTLKPVTNFSQHSFLDKLGNWNVGNKNKKTPLILTILKEPTDLSLKPEAVVAI